MIALKNILVAVDFEESSRRALAYGRDLAHTFGATLHVVTVVDNLLARAVVVATYVGDLWEVQRRIEADADEQLRLLFDDDDRVRLTLKLCRLTDLAPDEAIVAYAKRERIDLILLGTHGRRGVSYMFLGSVAERVVRYAPCPVLVVRDPEHGFLQPDALVATEAAPAPAAR